MTRSLKTLILTTLAVLALLSRASAQYTVIHVLFVDAATRASFGAANIPAEKFPATLDGNTVLNIMGGKWAVVKAVPASKEDFAKSGKLLLILSKDPKMFPGGVLFTVPTLSVDIARAEGRTVPGPGILPIPQSDWRQVEFVSTDFEREIAAEFTDIHDIRASAAKPGGFDRVHIRERIPAPVKGFTVKEVKELLRPMKEFDAVGFPRELGTVPHSFAWAVDPGLIIWGLTDGEGTVTRLCLAGAPDKEHIAALSEAFSKFTLKYDLDLVDWCREAQVHGDARDFEKYFGATSN